MTGEEARGTAARLRAGQELHVVGRLRAVARGIKARPTTEPFEVLANEIKAAGE
jgi:hypothetical protein